MPTRRALLAAPFRATVVLGQDRFPIRLVRLVIPVAVAGVTDIIGRILADVMGLLLGRPEMPENIAGAGCTVGGQAFHPAPAHGHTIFLAINNHAVRKSSPRNSRVARWRTSSHQDW